MPVTDVEALLRACSLRVTRQRVAVLEVLRDHPHADTESVIRRVRTCAGDISHQAVYDVLRALTVDRLHEPYRAEAFPQLPRLVEAARGAGALGACLSGAGSAILAFGDSLAQLNRIEAALLAAAADTDIDGRVIVVSPRNQGAQVLGRT